MKTRFLLMALLLAPFLAAQEEPCDPVFPPDSCDSTVAGVTPIPEPVLLIGLESYWTMSEATGVTRADSQNSNDFTVTTGPATQVAGLLGNATDQATLDASGYTGGVDGHTIGWWQEILNAGAPSVRSFLTFTGQGSVSVVADSGQTNFGVSIPGRPSGVPAATTYNAPNSGRLWLFFVVVVESTGIRTYQGDDLGTALDARTVAFPTGGDSFVAPTALNFLMGTPFGGQIQDDTFQYSRPLTAGEVALLYNGGAGNALYP
ncbi:MAG TPA: hypothetical protein VMZ92_03245 [Planctomycetota bacterium]|nr:hypothetical protein [Planctomycetota bacterium]